MEKGSNPMGPWVYWWAKEVSSGRLTEALRKSCRTWAHQKGPAKTLQLSGGRLVSPIAVDEKNPGPAGEVVEWNP